MDMNALTEMIEAQKRKIEERTKTVMLLMQAVDVLHKAELIGPGEHNRIMERLGRFAAGLPIGMRTGQPARKVQNGTVPVAKPVDQVIGSAGNQAKTAVDKAGKKS